MLPPGEAALRQHHPLRRLLDTFEVPNAALTLDGIILHASARFAEMLHLPAAELEGRSLEQLADGEPPGLCHRLLAAIEARPGNLTELILRRADSELVHMRVWLRGLQTPAVVLLTAFDVSPYRQITERLEAEKAALSARLSAQAEELAQANRRLRDDVRQADAAQAALRVSEAKWRRLFELSPTVIAVTTPDEGRILEANQTFLRILGYRREEVIGRRVTDLAAWASPERRRDWVAALKRDGIVENVEASVRTKAGEERLGLVSAGLVELEGQQVVLSVIRDITEAKRAEEALRLSEEKFSRAFRSSPAAMALSTLEEGRFLDVNDAFVKLTEYSREEVVGRTVGELGLWKDPQDRARAIAELRAQASLRNRECEYVRKSGEPFLGLASAELFQVDGAPMVLSLVLDITARKRAEDALAAQQRLLKAIVENAVEGITVRDAQGRLIFANPAARRMAIRPPDGTPLEEAPTIWGDTYDAGGHHLPVGAWPIGRALRGETVQGVEWHRLRPDGTRYVVVNSAVPLYDESSRVIGAVSVTTDITERTRTEERLRQALADKELLLREVHHRTKNNLQMLCDLLYLQAETLASPEGKAAIEDTYSRIFAIARLHEQLYRSLESGFIRVGEYLQKLFDGFATVYPGIPICLDGPPRPIYLDVDRAIHVGLIVNELVVNAVKHGFPAEHAEALVLVTVRTAGDQVELKVCDTGKGLPPELDVSRATTLGLRIVHILARRLGATLTVENAGGACFTITFPMEAEAPREPSPA